VRRSAHDRSRQLDRRRVRARRRRHVGATGAGRIEIGSGHGEFHSADGERGGIAGDAATAPAISANAGDDDAPASSAAADAASHTAKRDGCGEAGHVSAASDHWGRAKRRAGKSGGRRASARICPATDVGAASAGSPNSGDAVGTHATFWSDASLGIILAARCAFRGGSDATASILANANADTDQSVSRERPER
jgi:hypothetical protein